MGEEAAACGGGGACGASEPYSPHRPPSAQPLAPPPGAGRNSVGVADTTGAGVVCRPSGRQKWGVAYMRKHGHCRRGGRRLHQKRSQKKARRRESAPHPPDPPPPDHPLRRAAGSRGRDRPRAQAASPSSRGASSAPTGSRQTQSVGLAATTRG